MMQYLEEFNFVSVAVRLLLAMACGGVIGYGRSYRRKAAGFRTYMLVSIGGALTSILSLYYYAMMQGIWAQRIAEIGMKFDGIRFSAQAVTGIGFLAAGTILRSAHQKVEGLTTATGLLASVCLGIASGIGFYSLVLVSFVSLVIILTVMFPVELEFKRRTRNINIFVEVSKASDFAAISDLIRGRDAQILSIEMEGQDAETGHFSALYSVRLARDKASHSGMLSAIAKEAHVFSLEEIIS
jgi:putative Mg2+ transporter-C (MgtC) family protein